MKKFRSTHMQAAALMIDDRFKLGGKMYRVTGVQSTNWSWIIKFVPVKKQKKSHRFVKTLSMNVPKNTRFKVYNQK